MNGVEAALVKSIIPKGDQESGWREDTYVYYLFSKPTFVINLVCYLTQTWDSECLLSQG